MGRSWWFAETGRARGGRQRAYASFSLFLSPSLSGSRFKDTSPSPHTRHKFASPPLVGSTAGHAGKNPSHPQEVLPGLSWVVPAGPHPLGLFHTSRTGGCLYLPTALSCPGAPRTSHLPYCPFALKRRTAMKMRETRRRLPRTIQRMKNVGSRDSLSFTLTGTEDSGNRNPSSGGRRDGRGPLLHPSLPLHLDEAPHFPCHHFPPPSLFSSSHRPLSASYTASVL